MQRSHLIGFAILGLVACGDDGGGSGTETSGSTSEASTSTDPTDPSTNPSSTSDTPTTGTTDPGTSSTGDDGTTTDASSTGSGSTAADSSSGGGVFTVTSPDFAEGELFPFNMHICEGNVHPQLDWVNPPAGTMSFGVFFHDASIDFEHSAIWNIPADATGVPSGIEADPMPASVEGALQCQHWGQSTQLNPFLGPPPRYGYGGPGSCDNTYQFTVYALDVPTLDEEVDSESNRVAVQAALEAHAIETATLSGQTRGSTCIPMCTPTRE